MTKPIKYVARYNGQIIGARKSPRPYQFAIVVQDDEAAARASACGYKATRTDQSNFDYYVEVVNCDGQFVEPKPGESDLRRPSDVGQVRKSWPTGKTYVSGYDADEMTRAKARIAGGFDAYVGRLRDEAVEKFVQKKANGGFEPYVAGWSMSRKNAEKMAATYSPRALAIVPAEVEGGAK